MQDLGEIGKVSSFQAMCFVRVPPPGSRTIDTDPPDGAPEAVPTGRGGGWGEGATQTKTQTSKTQDGESSVDGATASYTSFPTEIHAPSVDLHHQLCRVGYLPGSEYEAQIRRALTPNVVSVESVFIERFHEFLPSFSKFARQTFQSYLVNAATVLNNSHTRCLKMFILSAFDMARDMLITPKKLDFAREKEDELYKSLLAIAVSKINEIKDLISETIVDITEDLKENAAEFNFSELGECCGMINMVLLMME